MLLQPLLENAFKHGVERSRDAGRDPHRRATRRRAAHVTVRNSGATLAADAGDRHRPSQLPRAARAALRRRRAAGSSRRMATPSPRVSKCPGSGTRMIRVLIVDDEAPARDKLRRWLAEQPTSKSSANPPTDLHAAAAIEQLAPDVVFLDIQMPGLCGLEVAAQLEPAARRAGLRHGLRRARDQGVRPERRRLSTEALRQGPAAQDAGAHSRAARRRRAPRGRADRARSDGLERSAARAAWRRRCSSSKPPPSTGSRPTTTTCTFTPRRRATSCAAR